MDAPYHKASKWANPQCEAVLRQFHALKYSFSLIVEQIRQQTGVIFTRNALIGRARRIGLPHTSPETIKPKPGRTPRRARPISARGTNSALLQRINRRQAPDFEITPWVPQAEEAFIGKPLLDLEPNQCRYPQGEGPFVFCGQPQEEGSSYCRDHNAACYLPHSSWRGR